MSQIRAILKKDISDSEQRKELEDMILNRKKRMIARRQQMQEGQIPEADPAEAEDKQLAKVYRLTGEAKVKGVVEFVD